MLQLERFGDVTRIHLSTRMSRAAGYSVSAYLVRDVLVDTGFPAVAREVGALLDRVRPAGAVITHAHEDHAGNAELVAGRGLPIAAGAATLDALQHPHPIGFYRELLWGRVRPLVSAIVPLEHDHLTLVPTPGHAHDHMAVWDAERETLFAGDLFLSVKVRVAHAGEDLRTLARSLRTAAALRPARLFDAHRGLVPNPVDSLLAKADWLDETIATIEQRIAAGWTDRAIARAVLGREDAAYYVSRGAMSKINFVRGVRAEIREAGGRRREAERPRG